MRVNTRTHAASQVRIQMEATHALTTGVLESERSALTPIIWMTLDPCDAVPVHSRLHSREISRQSASAGICTSWFREEQLWGLKCSGYDLLAGSDVRRRLVRGE